jgi:hypothetical protein
LKVFWFFFSKKNSKRFFLQKEAKTLVPLGNVMAGALASRPERPHAAKL